MIKTFTAYNDGGHGWVKVPKNILKELGIADKVTTYSYQRGADAYLEEDCDAGLFIETFEKVYGVKPRIVDKYSYNQSRVRGYENYTYLTPEQETELADLKVRMKRNRNWDRKGINRIDAAGLATLKYWQGQYGF